MKKNELNVSIGSRVRQVRENMGYTRESFSELCDISDSFLSDVERGNKSLSTKTLYKICTATHISADFIVLGEMPNISTHDSITNYILSTLLKMSVDQRLHAANILKEYYLAIQNL